MARAIYQHELSDPDFCWLIQRFQENNPNFVLVETSVLPLVLVQAAAQPIETGTPQAEAEDIFEPDGKEGFK